jgi:gamma-tubulin complex component 5
LKELRNLAEATLKKNSTWGRVDHFAVAKQLDGLQEKARVFNNDGLADALHVRLDELEQRHVPWAPEALSLLLRLSDRPVTLSSVSNVTQLKPPDSTPPLIWSDFDASGTAYYEEDIWQGVDFGAESSDDEFSAASSDVSIPRILPQGSNVPGDEFVSAEALFLSGEDQELIASIKKAQFWEEGSRDGGEAHSRFITELQTIREIIFMLLGLPTPLFWHLDDTIEVDRRYALRHTSHSSFMSLLVSLTSIGSKVKVLRKFTKTPQRMIFMQTFLRGIEDSLYAFDASLSRMQSRYISPNQATAVSLLQLFEDIRKEAGLLVLLADLVLKLRTSSSKEPFRCLDLFYNLVCLSQASGDDDNFRFLAKFFFACFEAYIRPIRLWMEKGQLDATQGTFFITDSPRNNDLRNLWVDWYTFDESSGQLHVPKFLKHAIHKVFTTGKNMVFLRNLNMAPDSSDLPGTTSLSFDDICPDENSLLLFPFSTLLGATFDKLVDANHVVTSNLLREQLGEQCGLWTSLEALEYVYFCRDITISSSIDIKIFELIDKGQEVWNDRFLLTELVQVAFSHLACVDPSRLIVRSLKGSSRDIENLSRSVKVLRTLSIDYILPWPVANIITKNAVHTHQRVATFLMQIRRAKYILQRQRLRKENEVNRESEDDEDAIGYGIRHSLLWFINILYTHLTEFVIAMTTTVMRKSLSAAKDVDSMITVHQSYMVSLELQCLLSKSLEPIYQAVISVLDLSVHFADIQAARHGKNQFDQTSRSFGSSTSQKHTSPNAKKQRRRHQRWQPEKTSIYDDNDDTYENQDLDDTDNTDDIDEDDDEYSSDEGHVMGISFLESPYSHRLRNLKDQFDQLLAFITTGLRSVGRVDGQQSWEILAEKFDWPKWTRSVVVS